MIQQSTHEDACATVAAALTRAWNVADATAFASAFTGDADFVNIFALHVVGREAIAKQHQAIFDTIYRGSVSEFAVAKVRRISEEAIVALITAHVAAPEGPMRDVRTLITAVLVRDDGGWKIASFQNTREQPMPSPTPRVG